jgi:NACalpha-BTF3-like transcription factor
MDFFVTLQAVKKLIIKKKTMKRKIYEKPTMQVVKLKQQSHLLQSSIPDYEPVEW